MSSFQGKPVEIRRRFDGSYAVYAQRLVYNPEEPEEPPVERWTTIAVTRSRGGARAHKALYKEQQRKAAALAAGLLRAA